MFGCEFLDDAIHRSASAGMLCVLRKVSKSDLRIRLCVLPGTLNDLRRLVLQARMMVCWLSLAIFAHSPVVKTIWVWSGICRLVRFLSLLMRVWLLSAGS